MQRLSLVDVRIGIIAAAAGIAFAGAPTAGADTMSTAASAVTAPVSVTAVLEGDGDVDSVVLIGRSGQMYRPQGENIWKRDGIGGVSVDVGAATVLGKQVFVAGDRTPLFKEEDGVWYAHNLPNRGTMTVGVGGSAPVVGIRSHIYTIAQKRWKRMASTGKGTITAIWAGNDKRVYVGTSEGEIKRYHGKASNSVSHTMAKDDTVVALYGAAGKTLYAVSSGGAVLEVGAKSATAITIPDTLSNLVVHAGGASVDGTVYLAGVAGADSRAVLAQLSEGALTLVEELPALAAGDRFSVVYSGSKGSLLVATAAGVVRIRSAEGTWSTATVDGAPPEAPQFTHTAPARSK